MIFFPDILVAGVTASRVIEDVTDYDATHKELYSAVGIAEAQGMRPTMEDAHHIKITNDYVFFGLYDGHGGRQVANFAAQHLHNNIAIKRYKTPESIKQALTHAFVKTHDDLNKASFDVQYCGCTALVALLWHNEIFVANAGDSRAVVSNAGKAEPYSYDHKPERLSEKERIEQLGGMVIQEGWWDVPRVNGDLAVSRALGDKYLNPFVIPNPEIIHKKLTSNDDFLILACDGVWDVMSNQLAVDIVKNELARESTDVKGAAELLKNNALNRGSTDNISVMVVNLKKFQQK